MNNNERAKVKIGEDAISSAELFEALNEADDLNHELLGDPESRFMLNGGSPSQRPERERHALWNVFRLVGIRSRFGFCPDSVVPFRVPLPFHKSKQNGGHEVVNSPIVVPKPVNRDTMASFKCRVHVHDPRREDMMRTSLNPHSELRSASERRDRGYKRAKSRSTTFEVNLRVIALMITTNSCPKRADVIDDILKDRMPIQSTAEWPVIDWNLDADFGKKYGEWPLQPVEARNRVRYSYHGPHDFNKMKRAINVDRLARVEYDQQADAFDLELDPSAFLFRAYQIPGVGQIRHDVLAFYAMHGRLPDDWRELRRNGVDA